MGYVIPVVITVYADRSFSFITKTPPAAVLIKKAAGINTASGKPNKEKVASLTAAQVEESQDQDARPERCFSGSCMQHGSRHLPFHGRHRRGLRHKQWEGITLPA